MKLPEDCFSTKFGVQKSTLAGRNQRGEGFSRRQILSTSLARFLCYVSDEERCLFTETQPPSSANVQHRHMNTWSSAGFLALWACSISMRHAMQLLTSCSVIYIFSWCCRGSECRLVLQQGSHLHTLEFQLHFYTFTERQKEELMTILSAVSRGLLWSCSKRSIGIGALWAEIEACLQLSRR